MFLPLESVIVSEPFVLVKCLVLFFSAAVKEISSKESMILGKKDLFVRLKLLIARSVFVSNCFLMLIRTLVPIRAWIFVLVCPLVAVCGDCLTVKA